ncbi:type I glyceraldehyde-3-phosphate dehydrogenase [candidate division KSB1 bacterium]|nr:type I glyceraldehyde-3-phosphate dehydrogenase [candidate division KSB1 bacterium]
MSLKVGINGFGRIGRNIFRAAMHDKNIEIVAVNDITDARTLAHLLKYDSILGNLEADIKTEGNAISVNGKSFKVFAEKDPAKLPWKDVGVSVVIESTGRFTNKEDAVKHITNGGAKKVIISAPAKGHDVTLVMGVNDGAYDPAKHHVLSNASCTTNCLTPVAKVIMDTFGIRYGLMTTIHSYTNDQQILDLPHKDLRRARAAGLSMIPTTTGAAKAVAEVIPALKGKMDGLSVRVPTPNVSLVDVVFEVEKKTTVEEVNNAIMAAANGPLKGILSYTNEPLVSIDFRLNPNSSIVDLLSTFVINGTMVKVLSWYDNEWGFSCRVIDLLHLLGRSL